MPVKKLRSVIRYGGTLVAIIFLGCMTVEFAVVRQSEVPSLRNAMSAYKRTTENDKASQVMEYEYKLESSENNNVLTRSFGIFKANKKRTNLFLKRPEPRKRNDLSLSRMQAVVIVASFRTGSSFVGQLFNQHPDVFYLFEPLFFTIWNRPGGKSADKILEDLFMCNMTSMRVENFLAWQEARQNFEAERNKKTFNKLRDIVRCLKKGLCFRGKSKALCTKQMCGNDLARDCKKHCYRPPDSLVQKSCTEAKVRVVKVIRIEHLASLESAARNENIDLRVIHLVRDPRPTLLSRLRLMETADSDVAKVVSATCARNFQIHSDYLTGDPQYTWLKGRYKLLRYEDVIEDPLKEVQKLYEFLNFRDFSPSHDVTKWLQESTTSSDANLFGTSRDLRAQKFKWRLQIPFSATEAVQKECKDMMELFGYKLAVSNSHLLAMNDSLLNNFDSDRGIVVL